MSAYQYQRGDGDGDGDGNSFYPKKRKRTKSKKKTLIPPTPLGVLEFSSALNGDDPLLVLEKLRQFADVVRYERRWALSPLASENGRGDGDVRCEDECEGGDASDDGDGSLLSLNECDDGEPPSKRRNLTGGSYDKKKTPSWKLDKNEYGVPFVGTSVAKGVTGTATKGSWPTGFLEAYRNHSPSGAELIGNEHISALPPSGIHRGLCKDSGIFLDDEGGRKRKSSGVEGGQTRGFVVSIALQTSYWTALSEWMLGYAPAEKLRRELSWELSHTEPLNSETPRASGEKTSSRCAMPPHIMTILMKRRLPEWVEAVRSYAAQQQRYAQQKKKDRQRQQQEQAKQRQHKQKQQRVSKDDQQREEINQKVHDPKPERRQQQTIKRQLREERLFLSALLNLITLCHMSDGTAREVLRRLTAATGVDGSPFKRRAGIDYKGKAGADGTKGFRGGDSSTAWMMHLFQNPCDLVSSSLEPQILCLQLACTMLETGDYTLLSRATEVPPERVGKSAKVGIGGGGIAGPAYIALRYGTQMLIELCSGGGGGRAAEESARVAQSQIDSFACCMSRLLKDISGIILSSSPSKTSAGRGEASGERRFVLGVGPTAALLSGVVLSNISEFLRFAPNLDDVESVQIVIDGRDEYENLLPVEITAVHARRLLFLLLSDTHRSPLLQLARSTKLEEQSTNYLSQLAKSLHHIVSHGRRDPLIKKFSRRCLRTTPGLVPHFFRELQVFDHNPTYRSLEALAFVENAVYEAPSPREIICLADVNESFSEYFYSVAFPSCITRTTLGKVIQSPSALMVSSGLKLIIAMLGRAHDCMFALVAQEMRSRGGRRPEQFQTPLAEAMLARLPEVSLLLSIPSRFDPFKSKAEGSSCANAIVLLQLCEALQRYARLEPSTLSSVNFDWAKLLPSSTSMPASGHGAFSEAEPLLQYRILQTLLLVSHLKCSQFSSKMMPNVLSALVSTTVPEVYTSARKLALSLIENEIFPAGDMTLPSEDSDEMQCREYELSLWIDGIGTRTYQELVSMIRGLTQRRVWHKIVIYQAWKCSSMGGVVPSLGVSSLLSSSLCLLLENEYVFSKEMTLLLIQIATEMLFFQANPKPFAAVIAFCAGESISTDKYVAGLQRAAASIFKGSSDISACIDCLSDAFLPQSHLKSIIRLAKDNDNCEYDRVNAFRHASHTALRQCLSIIKYSGERNKELFLLVRKITIIILEETSGCVPHVILKLASNFKSFRLTSTDMESIIITLLSVTKSKQLGSRVKTILDGEATMKLNSVGMGVVSALLRCTLITGEGANAFITGAWEHCSSTLKMIQTSSFAHLFSLRDFLLRFLLNVAPKGEDPWNPSLFAPGVVFDLWALVSSDPTSKLALEFSLRLEKGLTRWFEVMDGKSSWVIYQRACGGEGVGLPLQHVMNPQVFVDLCLNTIQRRNKQTNGRKHHTLLKAVLEYDCSKFSCVSSLFASMKTDQTMEALWHDGHLDLIAATFVLQALKQKDAGEIFASEHFLHMSRMVGRRFLDLLSRKGTLQKGLSFNLLLSVLKGLYSKQIALHEGQEVMLNMLADLEKSLLGLTADNEIEMMKLAICAVSPKHSKSMATMTNVFLRCCKILPKKIKKMMQTRQKADSCCVESLLQMIYSSTESENSFDLLAVSKSQDAIDACIVACLKYGMMDPSEYVPGSILGGCLKMIRLLMMKSHDSRSLGSLAAAQVHIMATSHSSFQTALSGSSKDTLAMSSEFFLGVTQQWELARLLLCTLSLDSEQRVKVDGETLTVILSVYNASTSMTDRLLRRLIFLYEQNDSVKDQIMLNNLRWGPLATRQNAEQPSDICKDESWEWLLDALEFDRIRTTLSRFPIADTLDPQPFDEIEYATASASDFEQEKEFWCSANEQEEMDSNSCAREMSVENDLCKNADVDSRYSPGFILPLILAAIEGHLPYDEKANSEGEDLGKEFEGKSEVTNTQCEAFGNICRRVCNKGGIALSIASLSSRCPSLRKMAVCICGLFLKALQMKESHGIKSWQERPQQEMILSSIQRGLSVRRAIQVHRYGNKEEVEPGSSGSNTHKYNIPMLPAISAIFLAKALQILSKPADDMYGQMNRYFLRLTDYHGAFQDCFGLPTFLSLYCSSSDELSRCWADRNWALLALKDGSVDEFCFQIISKHHIPELLTSSLDSIMDIPEMKSELYLTLDVIGSLLQSGGKRASIHLIERQGLLSWLHGIISWRKVSSIFPYDALKCKYLKLISIAVNSHRCFSYTDDNTLDSPTFYEKIPLVKAVTKVCLEEADTKGCSVDRSHDTSTILLGEACHSLWELYLVGQESQIIADTQQGSVLLLDMTSLMKKFVLHEGMFQKVLTVICDLPFAANDNDSQSAKLFCELALSFILTMRTQLRPDTVLLSLKKTHELLISRPHLRNDASVLSKVIDCRHTAIMTNGADSWDFFLPYLIND